MTKNTDFNRITYPVFADLLHTSNLVQLFTPTSVEVNWACSVIRSKRTRCHVLTLLKTFQTLGRFILPTEFPRGVVEHIIALDLPVLQATSMRLQY